MARIVGIDLGTYSVKVVHLETKARGGFEVVKVAEALLPEAVEGAAPTALVERHDVALTELKAAGLLVGDTFVTGLPGHAAAVRTLKLPLTDAKKIADAVPFALESEIPLDLDDIVLSWGILGTSVRAKREGSTAAAVTETDVLVAYAKKDAVQEHLNLLASFGIDPRHVEFEPLALDDLYDQVVAALPATDGPSELRTPGGTVIDTVDGPEPAVAIVDVGHTSTSVCVLAGKRVISAQTVLHGGADATRALSRAIGLPLQEAERGKRKEAFIEVAGARAQFPEQQQISETLKAAHAPIVRRLRQIFQASISQARVRVVKVILVGGGSCVLNLDRHLAEELNIKVSRCPELGALLKVRLPLELSDSSAAQYGLAFAYALSGAAGQKTRSRIDFRTAEFAYKGDFDFLRDKAPAFGAWAAALMVLLLFSGVARAWVLGSSTEELDTRAKALCKQITGQELPSDQCIAEISNKINGAGHFAIPERSAADTYFEIARRLPASSEFKRKIVELDITDDRVRMRGTTATYEGIDSMVEHLKGGRCFSLVEKGKTQNKAELIEFNITITLDCAAAPGDEAAQNPKEGKSANAIKRARTVAAPTAAPTAPVALPDAKSDVAPDVAPAAYPPSPMAPTESVAEDVVQRPGKLTAQEIDERRERLRKLREERDQRRGRLGELPLIPGIPGVGIGGHPNLRDRVKKVQLGADGDRKTSDADGEEQ